MRSPNNEGASILKNDLSQQVQFDQSICLGEDAEAKACVTQSACAGGALCHERPTTKEWLFRWSGCLHA